MDDMDSLNIKNRVILKGIHSSAWEHPTDKIATNALKSVDGFGKLLQFFFGRTRERAIRLLMLASAVRVSSKQFRNLYKLHEEACSILDMSYKPELYVAYSPFLNAGAIGLDKPFIVINSSALEIFDNEELLFLIGHELGHIKSNHVKYKTLLYLLLNSSRISSSLPMSQLVVWTITNLLLEWDRKSELSADRAGLLVVQDPDVSIKSLMKMAGGIKTEEMDVGEFIQQSKEYSQLGSAVDSVYKILNVVGRTHPLPVTRVAELIEWVRTGKYNSIIEGYYRGSDDAMDNLKESADSYLDKFKKELSDAKLKAKNFYEKYL